MIFTHIYQAESLEKEQSQKLLLANLSKYLDKDANEIRINKNENGKPSVNNLFFSVSHSHDYLIQSFSADGELGVDIEKINPKRNYLSLANRYFSNNESKHLSGLDDDKACGLFYKLWTAKESVCKAEGGRLWFYLNDNYLSQEGKIKSSVKELNINHFNDVPGYKICIAAAKTEQEIKLVHE